MAPALVVTSRAFRQGDRIPDRFTCKGADASPPLSIAGVPREAKTLALILDDPDAPRGTWTHWTAWNIPADTKEIAEGADLARAGARQGITSAGSIGYHGPCPPSGTHRYFVRVYALGGILDLKDGSTVEQFRKAVEGQTLASGELMGTFSR